MTHGGPAKRKPNKTLDGTNMVEEFPPPPDGGYGWIVVLSSFLIHIITDGITYSFGVMYIELLREFDEGKAKTSWILSLMCGMTLCSGPISSSFVNKYGCRAVTIAGAILASACLLVSYYAQNVLTLIVTIGLGVGCGLGLIYLPAIVSVSSYFEKKRSIAIGIAVAGSGMGTFIFAPVVAKLIEHLGWRNTLLVLSGIVLHCALFGALFRPLKPTLRAISSSEHANKNGKENESLQSAQNNGVGRFKARTPSIHVPSIAPISETGDTPMPRSQSVGHGMKTQYNDKTDDIRYMLSQPLLTDGTMIKPLSETRRRSSGTLSRPDIFYQGSLHNISNFKSQAELQTDVEKFGSLPRVDEHENEESAPNEMTKFGLLADPIFLVFVLSNFATCLGFYVPYFYLADKAKMYGMTTDEAASLLSIIGVANTIGRIILGYISDKPWINRLWVYSGCLFACGLATAASILCMDFYSLAVYSAAFGFLIGAYVGLTSVILVDLLGLEKLTNAFGILLLFQGLASYVGPPIVGMLYDHFKSYTPGFLFGGVNIALSGFVLFFIPTLQRYFAKRQARRGIKQSAKA